MALQEGILDKKEKEKGSKRAREHERESGLDPGARSSNEGIEANKRGTDIQSKKKEPLEGEWREQKGAGKKSRTMKVKSKELREKPREEMRERWMWTRWMR